MHNSPRGDRIAAGRLAGTVAGAAFLACLAAGAVAEVASPASTPIGELTLTYDDDAWRVEGGGRSFRITCLADSCYRSVLDVRVEPDDGYCDREAAYRNARGRFPFLERHAVNPRTVGNLAYQFAQSANDPIHAAPSAVYACLSRERFTYHVASVLEGEELPPFGHAGAVDTLLRGLVAPPGEVRELTVAGISLSYMSDRWRPVPGHQSMLHCLPPTCSGFGPFVTVRAAEGETGCPPQIGDDQYRASKRDLPDLVAGAPGNQIRFRVESYWSGCRNATPPRHLACAVNDGTTYRIEAPGTAGCLSGPGLPLDAFTELVGGIRLRP